MCFINYKYIEILKYVPCIILSALILKKIELCKHIVENSFYDGILNYHSYMTKLFGLNFTYIWIVS